MKNIIIISTIIFLLSSANLSALLDCNSYCDPCDNCCGIAVTVKNGFFYPQDGNKGGYWVEGACSYTLWNALNAEASGSYFNHKRFVICNNRCSEVKLLTLGFGLKYFFCPATWSENCCGNFFERFTFFVGGGLRLFFYHELDNSAYAIQWLDKTVPGGMINLGIEFDILECMFIDLFVDYNIAKATPKDGDVCCAPCCNPCTTQNVDCYPCCPCISELNLCGVVAGIGLGVKF